MALPTTEELAEALEWAANNSDIFNGKYGTSDPDAECPWEMGEVNWDDMARLALDRISLTRSLRE